MVGPNVINKNYYAGQPFLSFIEHVVDFCIVNKKKPSRNGSWLEQALIELIFFISHPVDFNDHNLYSIPDDGHRSRNSLKIVNINIKYKS